MKREKPGLFQFVYGKSIKDHLVRMQLVVACVVLTSSLASFIAHDLSFFKVAVLRDLSSTARVLASALVRAVASADALEARNVLLSLQGIPDIEAAQVYDARGNLFTSHGPSFGTRHPVRPLQGTTSQEEDGYLYFFQSLGEAGRPSGLLVLKASLGGLHAAYREFSFIVAGVILSGLLVGYALAHAMQGTLSGPISDLLKVTKEISKSGDYSLRVANYPTGDVPEEIASLSREFDRMLDQIAAKEKTIRDANQLLEIKVDERTEELRRSQTVALANAHAAGMAEVATGTLHNIGNLINSLGVSIEEIQGSLRGSCLSGISKAVELLRGNRERLASYLTQDPKGTLLPDYLREGACTLRLEQAKLREEAVNLAKIVQMIKDVVANQQAYAKGNFLAEDVDLAVVVEDILSMQDSSFRGDPLQLEKRIAPVPTVRIHRTKLAHIVLNLVKNAKEAMRHCPEGKRKLGIEIGQNAVQGVYLKVSDSGEGVRPENLQRIFNHGFTTKEGGHGFGLHFCANAMSEMGGKLTVASAGAGKGATFTLAFGPRPPARAAAKPSRPAHPMSENVQGGTLS